jgi:uncharacterized membrane protein YphA (DoxX/SURF4 family)
MKAQLVAMDNFFINWLREYADECARVALFIIFFWFGILKLYGLSPAGPLVEALLQVTFLNGLPPEQFLIWFGGFEAITGFLILVPRLERLTFFVLLTHLVTTVMPLFLLPEITWYQFPIAATLTGQYIIKNLALLSIGLLLYARIIPMSQSKSFWAEEDKGQYSQ